MSALRISAALLAATTAIAAAQSDEYARERAALLREIERTVTQTARETGRAQLDRRVLEVLGRLPRQLFVPSALRDSAYDNRPLPIGHGQTISQPYIVALMTDLLQPQPDDVVLEIGTGSGYQAAVLAELVRKVYTIEIIAPLGEQARERLAQLGYKNIETRIADGYHGWPEHAPFDGIVVTAAAAQIPPPLIRQLRPGGRMVIPVGSAFFAQTLMLVEKDDDGMVRSREILPVRFVPLTGQSP
ncbi:MAG: protein-L-isoaspartate(D-aspartate) O-methyltransferase [Pseudomonadota bacterium]